MTTLAVALFSRCCGCVHFPCAKASTAEASPVEHGFWAMRASHCTGFSCGAWVLSVWLLTAEASLGEHGFWAVWLQWWCAAPRL